MRSCVLVVALVLSSLSELQTLTAQSADPGVELCAGQRVLATWYASGSQTASGRAFHLDGLTAAHRTLPFGSKVTVTNPRNGKSVTVVITDRGPFSRGITIDLAQGAARAIAMKGKQLVCVAEQI